MCRRVHRAEPYRLTGTGPAPLAIQSRQHGLKPGSFIAGFIKGADTEPVQQFPAPKVPPDFQPVHRFEGPLHTGEQQVEGLPDWSMVQY